MCVCFQLRVQVFSTFMCFVGSMMFSVILVLYGSMSEEFPFCICVHTAFPFPFFPPALSCLVFSGIILSWFSVDCCPSYFDSYDINELRVKILKCDINELLLSFCVHGQTTAIPLLPI